MKGAKYEIGDKVTLIRRSEFGYQFEEWNSPYATITNIESSPGIENKGRIWCDIKTPSNYYTNSYPEKDLLPYFSHNLRTTNKQASILLEAD